MSLIYSYVNHSGHVIVGVDMCPLDFWSNPNTGMDVHLVCCVLCKQWPLQQADHSFKWALLGVCVCLIVCDLETSTMRRPRAELDCCIAEKEFFLCRKLFKYSQLVNVIIMAERSPTAINKQLQLLYKACS
jgi:hypothetical protein